MISIKEMNKFDQCLSCGVRSNLYAINVGIQGEDFGIHLTLCKRCLDALGLLIQCKGETEVKYVETSVKQMMDIPIIKGVK